jgi:hypothetical protein
MALIQKTNPVGVDRMIDRLQTLLYDSLGWIDISDYTEVFLNDNLYAQSIILTDDMMSVNNKQFKTKAHLIFHVNLNDLYPSVEHRADEECHVQVIKAVEAIPFVKIERLVKGLRNVYSGMRVSNILDSDLHPFHCFKLELELVYKYDCKLDAV